MSNGERKPMWSWLTGILVTIALAVTGYTMGRVDKAEHTMHTHCEKPMHDGTALKFEAVEGSLLELKSDAAKQDEFIDEQREFNAEQRAVNREVIRKLDALNGAH